MSSELKSRIDQDLKTAMLGGDKSATSTLRMIKSAILYAEVAAGKKQDGLNDQEIVGVFQKEAKKRRESIELYDKAGEAERAAQEKAELKIIEEYLPAQASEEEMNTIVDQSISETGVTSMQDMGKVMAVVKQKLPSADGAMLAQMVKERLGK